MGYYDNNNGLQNYIIMGYYEINTFIIIGYHDYGIMSW